MSKEKRYNAYIICTSPRSGSTLLCRLLAATGKSGNPDSHFHSPSVSDWMRNYGISPSAYGTHQNLLKAVFQAAHIRGTGNSRIFGLRLQRKSFDYFMQKLCIVCAGDSAESDVDLIQNHFGKTLFIHLTRRSKLEQAISFVKATQSGLWHQALDGTEIERKPAEQELTYDAKMIGHHLKELTDMEAQWVSWFVGQDVEPLRINYEDLSVNPVAVLAKVLEHMGVNRKFADDIEVPTAQLADETNKLWATRFLCEQHNKNSD